MRAKNSFVFISFRFGRTSVKNMKITFCVDVHGSYVSSVCKVLVVGACFKDEHLLQCDATQWIQMNSVTGENHKYCALRKWKKRNNFCHLKRHFIWLRLDETSFAEHARTPNRLWLCTAHFATWLILALLSYFSVVSHLPLPIRIVKCSHSFAGCYWLLSAARQTCKSGIQMNEK